MNRTALLTSIAATALIVPFAAKVNGNDAPPAPAGDVALPVVAVAVGTVGEIETGIPVPARKGGKGGGASPYKEKIEALEVGQSFHVAGKTKRSLNSTMHTFNKNFRTPELDVAGQPVTVLKIGKNKAGQETRKNVAKYTETRKFEHYDVDATDPKGTGVRIFRTK